MRVSVIIPFHKYEHFLTDCLNSLRDQQFQDYEVILVLDNYLGDIEKIIGSYRTSMNINVFKLEGKTGVAAARNFGLEKAKGEFVFFLDSDDYVYENAIGELIEAVDTDGADVVYCKKNKSYFKRDIFLPIFKTRLEERAARLAELEEESDEDEEQDDETFEDEEAENAFEEAQYKLRHAGAAKRLIGKKRRFGQISVLGILIRREVIEENKLRFDERFKYYSDISLDRKSVV